MARKWSPKYKCFCKSCGWKGKRTGSTMCYKCPKCGGMVRRMEKDKLVTCSVKSEIIYSGKIITPSKKLPKYIEKLLPYIAKICKANDEK